MTYQNAIKLGRQESQAGLLSRLGKDLVLHLEGPQGQGVRAKEPCQRPASVLDGELGAVFLQSRNSISSGVAAHA
jgi:hypothetical protein